MLRVSKSAFHDHTRFFTGTRMVHMEASDRNPVSNFIRVHDRRGTWDCTQASDPSVAVVKSRSTSRQNAPRNSTLAALCAAVALPKHARLPSLHQTRAAADFIARRGYSRVVASVRSFRN